MNDMDSPIVARNGGIRGDSIDSEAVDAAVPGIAGNEYRGPSRPTTSTGTSRRIQMAKAYPTQNLHPCAIDGCTRAPSERRCAEHLLEEVRRGD